jgi:hypothetical protein
MIAHGKSRRPGLATPQTSLGVPRPFKIRSNIFKIKVFGITVMVLKYFTFINILK